MSTTAAVAGPAAGPTPQLPKVGDTITAAGWPTQTWMYDAPSANDAAGKITIIWSAIRKARRAPTISRASSRCADTGKVYIVAYINAATSAQAKKLDPIRDSEGVGKGTVAFGKGAMTLTKQLGLGTNPTSLVVDASGKVQLVSLTGDAQALDARDAKVNDLAKQVPRLHDLARWPDDGRARPEVHADLQGHARELAELQLAAEELRSHPREGDQVRQRLAQG